MPCVRLIPQNALEDELGADFPLRIDVAAPIAAMAWYGAPDWQEKYIAPLVPAFRKDDVPQVSSALSLSRPRLILFSLWDRSHHHKQLKS